MSRAGASSLAAAIALIAVLSGCGQMAGQTEYIESREAAEEILSDVPGEPIRIETETETETPEETADMLAEAEKNGLVLSYLTGELVPKEQARRRPLAVMMSNDKAALPQYGINRAGVVYEAPVEGDMNRYMALMEQYDDLERIGSVRSCRTYYVYFAKEFDAIYAHYGQSTFAKPYLSAVDNINGLEAVGGTAYYRSKDRKAPHNAYASFSGIQRAIAALGYSQEYDSGYSGHFQFARPGEKAELTGGDVRPAFKVAVGYRLNHPWFEYREEDGLYYRYQYGAAHEGDEGPIAVKNLIIQYCSAGYYATTEYRNINVHESSWGYYITEGQAESMTWSKDGEYGTTHYYDSSGNEIVLNPGKTWICIAATSDKTETEITGPEAE